MITISLSMSIFFYFEKFKHPDFLMNRLITTAPEPEIKVGSEKKSRLVKKLPDEDGKVNMLYLYYLIVSVISFKSLRVLKLLFRE